MHQIFSTERIFFKYLHRLQLALLSRLSWPFWMITIMTAFEMIEKTHLKFSSSSQAKAGFNPFIVKWKEGFLLKQFIPYISINYLQVTFKCDKLHYWISLFVIMSECMICKKSEMIRQLQTLLSTTLLVVTNCLKFMIHTQTAVQSTLKSEINHRHWCDIKNYSLRIFRSNNNIWNHLINIIQLNKQGFSQNISGK